MRIRTAVPWLALLIVFTWAVRAEAADPTGTWTWKVTGQKGKDVDFKLTLKAEGEKLTGSLERGPQGRSVDIANGTFKNDEVTFETSVERQGKTATTKYKGKVDGDTLKGTSEGGRPSGGGKTRDWEAKRSK